GYLQTKRETTDEREARSRPEESAGLLDDSDRLLLRLYHLACDDTLPNLLLTGEGVHQVEHHVLDDHAQTTRADLAGERGFRDRFEGVVGEPKLDVFVIEQPLILPGDGVARLREDLHERRLVQLVQDADHREAAD